MGNPDFSLPVLNQLHNIPDIELSLVCGGIDKKVGRGQKFKSPPTIEFAKVNGIPFLQCENINKSQEFNKFIEKENIDLVIVFAFSHFLGSKILNFPRIGCFNIHTSLLPKYRGSSPIHYALLNGDLETGVCVQRMVKKMDAGSILHEEKILITEDDDYETLCSKFHEILPAFTKIFLEKILNNDLSYKEQNEDFVTFAPLINKTDGLLKPKNDEFTSIKNKLRAFKVWPGVFMYINNLRYKILEVIESKEDINTGEIKVKEKKLFVGLKSTSMEILQIQPPGKRALSAREFINGTNQKEPLIITEQER